MSLIIVSHPDCTKHQNREQHPESPARLQAVRERLVADGLTLIDSPAARREHLLLAHTADYLDSLQAQLPAQGFTALDEDTGLCADSLIAASHAVGAVVHGIEQIHAGSAKRVFCATRPPGHHAAGDRATGFCLYNGLAVGALYARSLGFERVAVVDFDVHHGDGSEAILAGQVGIRFHSSFQHPLFPWTGINPSAENIHNTPLEAGSGGEAIRQRLLPQWQASLEAFQPDLILVSAGFDAHSDDPLAQLQWQNDDYALLGRWLHEQAQALCGGRILAVMEGGYHVDSLSDSVSAFVASWR